MFCRIVVGHDYSEEVSPKVLFHSPCNIVELIGFHGYPKWVNLYPVFCISWSEETITKTGLHLHSPNHSPHRQNQETSHSQIMDKTSLRWLLPMGQSTCLVLSSMLRFSPLSIFVNDTNSRFHFLPIIFGGLLFSGNPYISTLCTLSGLQKNLEFVHNVLRIVEIVNQFFLTKILKSGTSKRLGPGCLLTNARNQSIPATLFSVFHECWILVTSAKLKTARFTWMDVSPNPLSSRKKILLNSASYNMYINQKDAQKSCD
jgi:hypothetical protein